MQVIGIQQQCLWLPAAVLNSLKHGAGCSNMVTVGVKLRVRRNHNFRTKMLKQSYQVSAQIDERDEGRLLQLLQSAQMRAA